MTHTHNIVLRYATKLIVIEGENDFQSVAFIYNFDNRTQTFDQKL